MNKLVQYYYKRLTDRTPFPHRIYNYTPDTNIVNRLVEYFQRFKDNDYSDDPRGTYFQLNFIEYVFQECKNDCRLIQKVLEKVVEIHGEDVMNTIVINLYVTRPYMNQFESFQRRGVVTHLMFTHHHLYDEKGLNQINHISVLNELKDRINLIYYIVDTTQRYNVSMLREISHTERFDKRGRQIRTLKNDIFDLLFFFDESNVYEFVETERIDKLLHKLLHYICDASTVNQYIKQYMDEEYENQMEKDLDVLLQKASLTEYANELKNTGTHIELLLNSLHDDEFFETLRNEWGINFKHGHIDRLRRVYKKNKEMFSKYMQTDDTENVEDSLDYKESEKKNQVSTVQESGYISTPDWYSEPE